MAKARSAVRDIDALMTALAAPAPDDIVLDAKHAEGVLHAGISAQDRPAAAVARRTGAYSLILARLPAQGGVALKAVAQPLRRYGRTGRLDLLYLAACLDRLRFDGRAVVLLARGALTGRSKAHRALRQALVEEHRLDAVIRFPVRIAKPWLGTAAAILVFSKAAAADCVGFYDIDDRGKNPRGAPPAIAEPPAGYLGVDVYPVLVRWIDALSSDTARSVHIARAFATRSEIAARNYDLSWRAAVQAIDPAPRRPQELLAELAGLEAEIFQGIRALVAMLK